MVEVGGLTRADDFCTPCSPGTFNYEEGQEECEPCSPNTYSGSGAPGSALIIQEKNEN